ncbi:hypothetical protein ACFLSJ_03145 [Verrucomicrobiota bacterium]
MADTNAFWSVDCVNNANTAVVPIENADGETRGAFTTRFDYTRGLLTIEHPWEPSEAGAFGQFETEVAAPEAWKPGQPLSLSFYVSDNYQGPNPKADWCPYVGAQVFLGHRFKQVLVNGQLVWESDVADVELEGPPHEMYYVTDGKSGTRDPYRVVDISKVVAADAPLRIAFRVEDKVASTEELAGDVYTHAQGSPNTVEYCRDRFLTTVFFGDVVVSTRARKFAAAFGPPESRQPATDRAPSFPADGIELDLVVPDGVPITGCPVTCGIPMPPGTAAANQAFRMAGPDGQPIPLSTDVMATWPDGSAQWLLCRAVAPSAGAYRLIPDATSPAPLAPGVSVRKQDGRIRVTNGLLTLDVGNTTGEGLFDRLSLTGGIATGPMALALEMNRTGWTDKFHGRRQSAVVELEDSVCTIVRVEGDLVDEKDQARFGRFKARIQVWAGLPAVLIDWTTVNESDQAMAMILDWSAHLALPDMEGARVDFGPLSDELDLTDIAVKAVWQTGSLPWPARELLLENRVKLRFYQERANQARLYRESQWSATTEHAPGFVNMAHAKRGIAAAMRWFAEEYPKGFIAETDGLTFSAVPDSRSSLYFRHDRPYVLFGRGEAKRQRLAIWLHDGTVAQKDVEAFNACVQDAPRFFNQDWFIESGAIECGPSRKTPPLAEYDRKVTKQIEFTGIGAPRLGHREYWDTAWMNDYRSRIHQGVHQYVETGDLRWMRYVDAAATHNRDIDIIHFCPEHPDWVGALHSYSVGHSSGPPAGSINLNVDSLLDHYLFTGDPDSLAAARGLAERMLTLGLDPWSRRSRNAGWPLAQLARWYAFSGDKRFLDEAKRYITSVKAYLEPRRGIYPEIGGTWNNSLPCDFMSGYLAFGLIRYYRVTGDMDVLELLEKLAAGMFSESLVAPGRFQQGHPIMLSPGGDGMRRPQANLGGLAGFLYIETGRPEYGTWARECCQALIEEADEPQHATLDMQQLTGWLLHAVCAPQGRHGNPTKQFD